MKRHLILSILFVAPFSLNAHIKPYLQNLTYYVENPHKFSEGQEDGRSYYIPSTNINLNGTWKFLYKDNPSLVPDDFFEPSYNDKKWSNIQVPSNWEMQGFGQEMFRNSSLPFSMNGISVPQVPMDLNPTGVYRKDFSVPVSWKDKQVFLRFEKVASASFVWVNGKQVGYNEGAQEPSEYNITKYIKPGKNTLAVLVLKYCDGYYLEDQDYWRLAGIFDDVYVYSSNDVRIWDYHVTTDFDKTFTDSKVSLDVDLRSYKCKKNGYSIKAEIEKDGIVLSAMTKKDISIPETVHLSSIVKSPKKWTAETPDLYNLHISLTDLEGHILDSLTKKMGFKKTEITNGVFYLNGMPIKVNAENSHMQHPVTGHAMVDESTIRKDMEILKQFGFNAVRTSHYPPVNKYLDLADEYGLYIIDETGDEAHGTEWVSTSSDFTDMYRERVRQMILRDRNHACVLFWSAGNESGEGFNITEVVKEGRKYDSTRYWMYGGNVPKHSAEDIVGPRYPLPIEHEVLYGLDTLDKRPSFMDEYLSVVGNGGGAMDDFWREIYSHPNLLGGALWDFVSPGLLEPIRTLEDKSPYGSKANIMGRAKLVKGPTGNAIDLNITDQWIQLYRSNNLEITGDKLTLTLDIYPRKYNSNGGYMITKGDNQFGLRQRGDKIEFYIYNGKRLSLMADLPGDWTNNWHKVCAVYDSHNMIIYVDSKILARQEAEGKIQNFPLSVCIGRNEESNGQETNKYIADAIIDNVGIFTDAITPEKGFDPKKSALWLDFEKETDEGTFYSYGLGGRTYGSIWPDRIPQPEMYQMKKSTQPIEYKLLDARTAVLEIINRNYFLSTSKYNTSWTITADDKIIDSGKLNLNIKPTCSQIINIPYKKPNNIEPGKEYRLNISTTLSNDEIWAKKGFEVAWEQFELSDWNIPNIKCEKPKGMVSLTSDNGKIITSGDNFKYIFDETTGALCQMQVNGKDLLKSPLKLNLWRAPLANEVDGWNSSSLGFAADNIKEGYGAIGFSSCLASMYYSEGLDKLLYLPISVKANSYDGSVYINVREIVLFGGQTEQKLDEYITAKTIKGFENIYSYCIDSDGTITINHKMTPQGKIMPYWFPRIGITLSLNKDLYNVNWYGRGPQASYPDRKTGYKIGIYSSNVDEMYEPYLIPQDYGLRMDNRWVKFTDKNGTGLQFSVDEKFAFNAYPFTTENLTKSIYQYQLQKSENITLNIDYLTSGVGCTARGIFEAYRAHATNLDRNITIKLVSTKQ